MGRREPARRQHACSREHSYSAIGARTPEADRSVKIRRKLPAGLRPAAPNGATERPHRITVEPTASARHIGM